MRYRYLGDRLTDPALKGMSCDPVRREDGKCISGRSKMLVVDRRGVQHVVLRCLLRKLAADQLPMFD